MKKNYLKIPALTLFLLIILGCSGQHSPSPPDTPKKVESIEQKTTASVEKIRTIEVYTLGKVSDQLLNTLMDSLNAHYPRCTFVKNLPLPPSAYYAPRKRYLAYNLNEYLTRYRTDDNIVVGLTEADISLNNFRGHPNFGIMGLAHGIGGRVSVFSDYRPKNTAQLFALMQHEIGHSIGLRHCPDTTCLMQDAHGGNSFRHTTTFCDKCKAFMVKHHWHF